jgi:hypothetical protein
VTRFAPDKLVFPDIHLTHSVSPACNGDEACHQGAANASRPPAWLDEDPNEPDARLIRRIGREYTVGV